MYSVLPPALDWLIGIVMARLALQGESDNAVDPIHFHQHIHARTETIMRGFRSPIPLACGMKDPTAPPVQKNTLMFFRLFSFLLSHSVNYPQRNPSVTGVLYMCHQGKQPFSDYIQQYHLLFLTLALFSQVVMRNFKLFSI